MKLTHYYIYMSAAIAMATACSDEVEPTYTVGKEDNAIQLRAGVVEGGIALTRAGDDGSMTRAENDGNHSQHVSLTKGIKFVWKADGKWKHGNVTSDVSKKSFATIGDASEKHNSVEGYDPVLYWDDYGTADPDNKTEGRDKGLSIYAAAVDGLSDLPSELRALKSDEADWQQLTWSVYDKKPDGKTMLERDLIVAYNLKEDKAFKFEDFKKIVNGTATDAEKNAGLLEFRHMMSKVTINLKAGEGFPINDGESIGHFENTPVVQLGEGILENQTAYAYTSCKVNVETGDVTKTENSKKIVVAEHITPATTNWSNTYHCLVVPGTCFRNTTNDIIAKIEADGNYYYVDGKAIRKAIYKYYHKEETEDEVTAGLESTEESVLNSVRNYETQSGINYTLNVTLNKTGIRVTATLVDWNDEVVGEVSPKVNINASWGATGGPGSISSFCLYRSASDPSTNAMNDMSGYSKGLNTDANNHHFPNETVVTKSGDGDNAVWTMTTQLYWPTHSTHYHFRGVTPATLVTEDSYGKGATTPAPHVEDLNDADHTQIIKVWDAEFGAGKFPSNLAIGKPIIDADTKCSNPDHTAVDLNDYGICATEGKINLQFEYMMSQVEVELQTTADDQPNKVKLENAKVEIINGYTEGYVTLGGREAIVTGDKGAFVLPAVSLKDENGQDLTGEALAKAKNTRRGAIVPQKLYDTDSYTATTPNSSDDTHNLRFKVTITNDDATTDIYYADIAPIKKKDVTPEEKVAPDGEWKSGQHYKYILKLSKTEIKVEATLLEWVTVEAVEDVWF